MARQSIPSAPSIRTIQYDNLLGVDYQSDATEINRRRSPDMVNMISDLGGIPVKRFGYHAVGDKYEGFAVVRGDNWAVKKSGTKLYATIVSINTKAVVDGDLIELSTVAECGNINHVLGFQQYLIVLCDNEWISYDVSAKKILKVGSGEGAMWTKSGDKITLVMPDESIIPTVFTMYKPNGRELVALPEGTSLVGATQGVNILTPFRRAEYCVTTETANETVFYIPKASAISGVLTVEVLDSSTFEWKKTTSFTLPAATTKGCLKPDDMTETTTDVIEAKITFSIAPYVNQTASGETYLCFADNTSVRVPSGQPNVRITYAPFNGETTGGEFDVTKAEAIDRNIDIVAHTDQITFVDAAESSATMTIETPDISRIVFSCIDGSTTTTQNFTYGTPSTQTVSGLNVEYDGDKTFSITVSEALDRTVTLSTTYYTKGTDSHQLSFTPKDGSNINVTYTYQPTGGTSAQYTATFTRGTPSTVTNGTYSGVKITYNGVNTFTFVNGSDGRLGTIRIVYTTTEGKYYGYFREDRNALIKTNAATIFDAKLFTAKGSRTYYSRTAEPFRIDDNYYFDVDNDVVVYNRTSNNLVIITEDVGNNTIYLASGEYDSALGMVAYTVRTSNAGVGAIAQKVSGVFNDEPIFLSSKGIYGITTNYYSEKYATKRSGKIDRRLCAEEDIKNSVGIPFNGYYYIAVGGHMYVLDSRHKDSSANGDNSYECFYFDNMPDVKAMFVVNNRMLFADDEKIYTWNDEIRGRGQYLDDAVWDSSKRQWDGTAVKAKWTSAIDNDGLPQYYKSLNKKGTYVSVAPPMQTSCQVSIKKDANEVFCVGQFNGMTFALSDSVLDAFTRKKIKKYKRLQFIVENNEPEPFGIISIVKSFTVGNIAKR